MPFEPVIVAMSSFFGRYKDLFEVNPSLEMPSQRLTANHPLFADRSNTVPLQPFKRDSLEYEYKAVNLEFQTKLSTFKKDRLQSISNLNNIEVIQPLMFPTTKKAPFRRPSSRKRSSTYESDSNQLRKLSDIDDLLSSESRRIQPELPIIRKISSHEVPPIQDAISPLKKLSLGASSRVSKKMSKMSLPEEKKQMALMSIEELKRQKPTHVTTGQCLQRRIEAERSLRVRQNRLRSILDCH